MTHIQATHRTTELTEELNASQGQYFEAIERARAAARHPQLDPPAEVQHRGAPAPAKAAAPAKSARSAQGRPKPSATPTPAPAAPKRLLATQRKAPAPAGPASAPAASGPKPASRTVVLPPGGAVLSAAELAAVDELLQTHPDTASVFGKPKPKGQRPR